MKNLSRIALALAFAAAGIFTVAPGSAEDQPAAQIIGAAKCNVCHKSAKRGNQAEVWEKSAHAQAFATLANEKAKAIAAEKGIADPQQAPECLRCHTTHAFLGPDVGLDSSGKYSHEEGVGCETCHGAGSEYKSLKIMKDHDAAVAAGLVLPVPEHCQKCHNEESPTYKEFKYEERWAQIAHPRPASE